MNLRHKLPLVSTCWWWGRTVAPRPRRRPSEPTPALTDPVLSPLSLSTLRQYAFHVAEMPSTPDPSRRMKRTSPLSVRPVRALWTSAYSSLGRGHRDGRGEGGLGRAGCLRACRDQEHAEHDDRDHQPQRCGQGHRHVNHRSGKCGCEARGSWCPGRGDCRPACPGRHDDGEGVSTGALVARTAWTESSRTPVLVVSA